MKKIVVGVDGSDASVEALRWALDEARARGAELEAVVAWTYPLLTILPMAPPPPTTKELRHQAAELLGDALARAGAGGAGVDVARTVAEGRPERVLEDASRGADLLVVGARGLGGMEGLVLGSVSRHCAQHADCPVVIVRSAKEVGHAS